jgi:hypothetical protein
VGDLKKRIKEEMEPELNHLDADRLYNWKVSASSWALACVDGDI